MTLGRTPELLIKLVSYAQDYLGGDGVGLVYTENNVYKNIKKIPLPALDNFIDTHKKLNLESIGNTYDLFSRSINFPSNYDMLSLHTRKITIGTVDIRQTQPFLLSNSGIIYTICHKGSVYNYKEIAKELLIPVGENDSRTIANAIACGLITEFLSKIDGHGIIAWTRSDEPDAIYTVCVSKTLTTPTNLYYFQYGRSLIVATSAHILIEISKSFHTINNNLGKVYTIPQKCIFKITANECKNISNIVPYMEPPTEKKLIKHISPATKIPSTPRSIVRLIPKSLIYFFEGKPVNSPYSVGLMNKNILDIQPILVNDKGFVLSERLENGVICYYRLDNVLFGTENSVQVYKLYFYRGLLMKDKAACKTALESKINDIEDLVGLTVYPVSSAFWDISESTDLYYHDESVKDIVPIFGSFCMHFNNLYLEREELIQVKSAMVYWSNDLVQLKRTSSKKLISDY